jgi:hypothetical protein
LSQFSRQISRNKGMSNRRYRTETSLGKSGRLDLKHFRPVCSPNQALAIRLGGWNVPEGTALIRNFVC